MSKQQAIRLAWTAAGVQIAATVLHLAWHAAGGGEPASAVAHYTLLHLPLHLGVVLLGIAVVVLHRRVSPTLPLVLLTVGVAIQGLGAVVDVAAVAGTGAHHLAGGLLAGGGVLALLAAAIGPCRRRLARPRPPRTTTPGRAQPGTG